MHGICTGKLRDLLRKKKIAVLMENFIQRYFIYCVLVMAVSIGCNAGSESGNSSQVVERDSTITETTSFSELFLDSILLEQFIGEENVDEARASQLRNFYNSRNFQFAWFTSDGITQQARAFWNLHNHYLDYSRDSSLFDQSLHQQMQHLVEADETVNMDSAALRNTELRLSDHFFDYAQYAYGGRVDPKQLKWNIPRKKVDPVALLDSLIAKNGQQLENWEPVSEPYRLLRKELLRFYELEKNGGWQQLNIKESIREGDSLPVVQQLKERLRKSGDFSSPDTSRLFTAELKTAVQRMQGRFGLGQDGVVGANTAAALNVPVKQRIEQMLVNMERMRWMPPASEGRRLVANIPEYRLHVFEGKKKMFDMRIVVGKAANKTVVFNDKLQYVVFRPYWNIPRSIIRNEILPGMNRRANYLASKNMEQTGTSNGLPVIRQKPGPGNSLGLVKFIFPNNYNIYFHDTPAKSLFDQNDRAFSHGCIRLQEPEKLAAYLLEDQGWSRSKVSNAMYSGQPNDWVKLDKEVAVVISYFTAWVDDEGKLNFREDIYGHDEELAKHLFE